MITIREFEIAWNDRDDNAKGNFCFKLLCDEKTKEDAKNELLLLVDQAAEECGCVVLENAATYAIGDDGDDNMILQFTIQCRIFSGPALGEFDLISRILCGIGNILAR